MSENICPGCGLPVLHKMCVAYRTPAYMDSSHPAWGNEKEIILLKSNYWHDQFVLEKQMRKDSDERAEQLEIMLAGCRELLEKTHFICERCGCSGMQEEGCYNADRKAYDEPAGICKLCGGCGFLGLKPTKEN